MNLSVRGSLFLTLSHQWRVSFPSPPQTKVVPTSALTRLLNSLGSLSSVIPYLCLQSPQWQSEAGAIVLPHPASRISNSLCSQERSFLCYFVWDSAFGLGHLAWSRCSMQLFPPVPARGRRLTWWLLPLSTYIPPFPLEIGAVGRPCGEFCAYCLSLGLGGCWQSHFSSWVRRRSWWALGTVFWLFGTLVSRATGTPCSLTELLSLHVKKKITWNLEVGRRAGRTFSVHCCSVGIDFLLCLSKD